MCMHNHAVAETWTHTHAHIRGSTQAHIRRRVQEEKGFEHQDVHAHTPPFQAVTDTHTNPDSQCLGNHGDGKAQRFVTET